MLFLFKLSLAVKHFFFAYSLTLLSLFVINFILLYLIRIFTEEM